MTAMNTTNFRPDAGLADDGGLANEGSLARDDVRTCVRVLRAIQADRAHLTRLGADERRELLTLAGLVAKPDRHDVSRMTKAFRRAKREATQQHDRQLTEQAGLRIQRRAAVYTPLWLERPKPDADNGAAREPALHRERVC